MIILIPVGNSVTSLSASFVQTLNFVYIRYSLSFILTLDLLWSSYSFIMCSSNATLLFWATLYFHVRCIILFIFHPDIELACYGCLNMQQSLFYGAFRLPPYSLFLLSVVLSFFFVFFSCFFFFFFFSFFFFFFYYYYSFFFISSSSSFLSRKAYVVHTLTPQLENRPMNYNCSSEDFHARELIVDNIIWTIRIHLIFFKSPPLRIMYFMCV